MLLEISMITVRAGNEDAFGEAMEQQGMAILRAVPGVISARYGRGVENPEKFSILVEWDNMAAHTAFRDLPVYPEFGKLFAPHVVGGAMEHFELV
jgi:heme-degrading monooxygenase HmoA